MDLIPAIDLLDGRAVRLVQGDYARPAASLDDPTPLVGAWIRAGVRWLHVVDLGGARAGRPANLDQALALAGAVHEAAADAHVELGGGLRRLDDLERALHGGIDVATLGTAAIEDPELLRAAADRWPGRVAVGIDLRDGRPAVDGWTRAGAGDPVTLARRFVDAGAAHIIVTDVARDGTRGGPNLELLAGMRAALPDIRLVAAGGVGSADDLRDLAGLGVDGAIVGLALLDGSLSIESAIAAAGRRVAV